LIIETGCKWCWIRFGISS